MLSLLFFALIIRNNLSWGYIWQIKEYRIDRFKDYIKSSQGEKEIVKSSFYFLVLIMIFIFFGLKQKNFGEIFFYGALVLDYLFLVYQIIEKKIKKPNFTNRFSFIFFPLTIFQILFIGILNFFYPNLAIIFSLLFLGLSSVFIGISIFLSLPISNMKKNEIIKKAKRKILSFPNLKIVGITGSYGKSTMKAFLIEFLKEKYKVFYTPKNINTPIGISEFINKNLNSSYDFFICEMGAYSIGEIREIGEIINHKDSFITGINEEHISLFGSINNIIQTKSEILEKTFENKGKLYINGDSKNSSGIILGNLKKIKTLVYGFDNLNSLALSKIKKIDNDGVEFFYDKDGKEYEFKTDIFGTHNILNLTGAISFALDNGISIKQIKNVLLRIKGPESRLEFHKKEKGIILVDDTYNSNPDSITSGCNTIKMFREINKNYKIYLIIDDILELGTESKKIHIDLGRKIFDYNFNHIFLTGVNDIEALNFGFTTRGKSNENITIKQNIGHEKFLKKMKNFIGEDSIFLFQGRRSRLYFEEINKSII